MNPKAIILSPEVYGYGALLIGGFLRQYGFDVHVSNKIKLVKDVNIIGLSAYSINHLLEARKSLGSKIKNSRSLFIVGGPAAYIPEIVFAILPYADIVVIGEGEKAITRLIKNIPLTEISNIAFKVNGKIVKNRQEICNSLSPRPLILIPSDLCHQNIRGGGPTLGPNIYIETHRGCMANCTFCLVPLMFGRKIRSRPMYDIIKEAKALKQAGIKRIAISGGTASFYGYDFGFTKGEAFISLLERLNKVTGKDKLTASDIRVDHMNEEILYAIKRYTSGWISLGIESGSDHILKEMQKGINVDLIIESIRNAKKTGVRIVGSFIAGYPGETEDDFTATKNLISQLKLDDYAINLVDPIPGTPLFHKMIKMKNKDNPLLQKAETQILNFKNISVATFRAITMHRVAYETIYNRKCPKNVLFKFAKHVISEHARILKSFKICKEIMHMIESN